MNCKMKIKMVCTTLIILFVGFCCITFWMMTTLKKKDYSFKSRSCVVAPQVPYKRSGDKYKLPYVAEKNRKEKIANNASKIEIGYSELQVLELLGEPDNVTPTLDKRIYNPEQIGFAYSYLVSKNVPMDGLTKDYDALHIYFDKNGYARRVDNLLKNSD